jgi:hypothetical protein
MQTTLRIDDRLYREAKAEAAREGTTLTRFIEAAIRGKLHPKQTGIPFRFRVCETGTPFPFITKDLKRIADEEQEKHDLAKIGLSPTDLP